MLHNATLGERFVAQMAAYGIEDAPPDPAPGSSDMGNVSQVVPSIHPHLAISAPNVPGHTVEFREAARTDTADDVTLLAGILVAQTAIELALDPALVAAIRQEFDERRGE